MVATSREGVGQVFIDGLAVVVDDGGLAVHGDFCPAHDAAVYVSDALMPQADAEQGYLAAEVPHHVVGNACFERRAWPRRDDDVAGGQLLYLLQPYGVVAVTPR